MDISKQLSKLEVQEAKLQNALKALESTEAYKQFIDIEKKVKDIRADIKDGAKEYLEKSGEKTVENDIAKITLVERRNFKAQDIPQEFIKVSLDTAKVGKHYDLYGELPKGVEMTKTKYVKWTDK